MLTVPQAFDKMRRDAELTQAEKKNVTAQCNALRERLFEKLKVERHFLTGSYDRATALRPLHDVDFFLALDPRHHGDLQDAPHKALKHLHGALRAIYPEKEPPVLQRRSVHIEFSGTGVGYDIVPAFARASRDGATIYAIPDRDADEWILSSPDLHRARLNAADQRSGSKLRPLIRLVKHWNVLNNKPLGSFHLECLSLSAFSAAPESYPVGLQQLLCYLIDAVARPCPDPAGVGGAIDGRLAPGKREAAGNLLRNAERLARRALEREQQGAAAEAHGLWRKLLGPLYPERGVESRV